MAVDDPTVGVNFDANAGDLAAQIDGALQKILSRTGRDISKVLGQIGREASKNLNSAKTTQGLNAAKRSAQELRRSLKAISDTTAGLQGQFGKAFDPRNVAGLDDQLKRLADLQQKLKDGAEALGDVEYERLNSELKAVSTGVIATRESFLVAARAAEEMRRNVERNARQASRVQVQESKAATGRYVVDAQTQAAAARDASRRQIEETKAASRQRVALIQAAARTIATIERGLRAVFGGTARAIGAAFRGVSNTASGVASGISRAFRRSSNDIDNSVTNISNSYSKSFRNATNTVNNETSKQNSIIRNFAREASSSISGIGAAGLAFGGLAALGVGKALTGGFDRATTIETANRGLEVLLGNAEEAEDLLGKVVDVVTGTPFALDQFAEGAAKLVAFNVQADKIPGILAAAGDAAALSGKNAAQTIDTLIRVTGQATASGKLYGDSILSLADAGIPALRILGNAYNEQTGDIQEMLTNGVIPAEEALDKLFDGIVNGTDGINGTTAAFGGLAKELGGTLSGAVSNFSIAFSRAGANLFKVFTPSIVAAAKAGTAAIDLIGSALASLAESIQSAPLFGVLQRGIEALGEAALEAKTTLKPLFDFIADGIVLFGQFVGAIFAFRRIPAIVNLVTVAFRRLFSPLNLLVFTGVAVAGFFQRMIEGSVSLQESLAEVGSALGRIGTVTKDLLFDAFDAVASAISGTALPAIESFSDLVASVLAPALDRLADFLLTTVLPAVRTFARVIREDVLPFIGAALARGLDIARGAFDRLSTLVREEVIPVVGPILERAVTTATNAFRALYRFLDDTLVPFIQSNLAPVLAGLGTALGVLAVSGGNIPLAGLAGATAGLVTVLSNEDIRNAIVNTIREAVDRARAALGELFSGDTLRTVVTGALRVANEVGRILGDILSDRRLLSLLAGIAAFGVALAGSFVAGFVEGVVNNIPELVDGLANALKRGLRAVFSDPAIAFSVVSGLLGAAVIAKLVSDGRKAGRVLAQAVGEGAVTAGTQGVGSGTRGLFSGLFGGAGEIRQAAARAGQTYGQTLVTAIRNEARLIDRLGGNRESNLRLGRIPGEPFVDQNRRLAGTLRTLTTETGRLEGELGRAAVAGVRLGDGLGRVASGNIRQGFAQLRTAVQSATREIGASAGIIAGGAFAASFVSQALFDTESSGKQKLQSALGTIAIGAATGQQLGGARGAAIGAGVGVLVSAIGFLTTRVDENEEAFKRAAAAADTYKSALDGLSDKTDIREAFKGQFQENLRDVEDVSEALTVAGFRYEQLEDVLTSQVTGGIFIAGVKRQLREANIEGEQFDATIQFLRDELRGFRIALDAEENIQTIFSSSALDADEAAAASGIATQATQAFKDKVNELNDSRLDGFRARLDEAKGKLNEAETAADNAKQALVELLNPPPPAEGQAAIDQTILGIDGIASSVGELLASNPLIAFTDGIDGSNVRVKLQEIGDEVGNLLANAPDRAAAETIAADLKEGLQGEDYGDAVIDIIDAQLEKFDTDTVKEAAGKLGEAIRSEVAAAAEATAAENALEAALNQNPLELPLIRALAEAEFKSIGEAGIAGLAEGYRDNPAARDAATEMARESFEAAASELGVSSPSTKFAALGVWSAIGFANGIKGSAGIMAAGARIAGVAAMGGLVGGLIAGSAAVYATVNAIAARVVSTLRNVLQINSPSRVMRDLGAQTMNGFALGMQESAGFVAQSAADAVQGAIDQASSRVGGMDITVSGQSGPSNFTTQARLAATAPEANGASGVGTVSIARADIDLLGRTVAREARPSVQVDQTFNEPVDSRAVAADVAWRLT